MTRTQLRVLFGIAVAVTAGVAGPFAPLVIAVATPVALIDYRTSQTRPPRRRAVPITAATPRRRPPAALRRIR